ETFQRSKLNWNEVTQEPHAGILRLYKTLLKFRGRATRRVASTEHGILLTGDDCCVAVQLRGAGKIEIDGVWKAVLTTEESQFTRDPMPPEIETTNNRTIFPFARPSAIILSAL